MNVRFIHKILLLILLPLIALTLLLGRSVLSEYQHAERLQALESEVKLTTFNSLLVHELQKERGATSGWLGSGTQAFADKLNRQRKLTDQALQRWQSHLQGSRAFSPEIRNILDNVRRQLSRLDSIRNNADLHNIELGKALGYYTDLNADLLSIAATTSSLSDNADIARHAAAFFAFLQAKERAGIERAVLSNVFSSDHFAPGLYPRFINLVSEQGTYLDLFRVIATADQGIDLDRLEASAAFKAVAQLRQQAHDRALDGGFGVAGTLWFDRATERINAMKAFEDRLAATLLNLAETAHTGAVRQIWFSALSLLGILLLVGIVSLWIIRGLHRQVDTLATTMNRVRNEQDLTVRARVLSRDELGVVAEQLNHTLDTFTSAIREVATSSKQLSSEADNTSQIVLQAEQSLKLQSDETMQVAAAVEEVSTAIQDVANSTASASDAAYQAETLVQHGHEKVRAAVTAVASLANDSKHLAEMTARLNDSSLRISDVTGVISNVSEQTNLLALNAAIEAARAGEHGRGFAVVADEVRTLAQRTQASTSEIDDIIRRLQQETQEAINLVESNQKDMSVATERAREVEDALDAIVAAIDNITNMSTQIAAAAEEESTAISDIGRNIAGIDTSAEAISDSARVLSEHARQQLQMAQQLNQMIQRFKT